MQHLEVSGAVRHIYIYIYIYVVRQLRVNQNVPSAPCIHEFNSSAKGLKSPG